MNKLEVLDFIIEILIEHERKIDELIHKFEVLIEKQELKEILSSLYNLE